MSVRARVSSGDPVTSDISRSPQAPCPPTNSQVTALHHDLAAPLPSHLSGRRRAADGRDRVPPRARRSGITGRGLRRVRLQLPAAHAGDRTEPARGWAFLYLPRRFLSIWLISVTSAV